MKMIYFTLIALFAVFSFPLNAQKVLPGYIVTLNGDTLSGTIKKDAPNILSQRISFFNQEQEQQTYKAGDIQSFYMETAGYFDSRYIKMTKEADSLLFFVRRIVDSDLPVFSLSYDFASSSTNYLETAPKPTTDPVYVPDDYEYFVNEIPENRRGVWYIVEVVPNQLPVLLTPRQYKEMLISIYGSCQSVKSNNSYRYTDRGIASLATDLAACNQQSSYPYIDLTKPPRTIKYQPGAGAQYVRAESNISTFENIEFDAAIAPALSLLVEFPTPSNFAIQTGLTLSAFKVVSDSLHTVPDSFKNAGETFNLQQSMDFMFISIPLNIKYYISDQSLKPYVLAGLHAGGNLNSNATIEEAEYSIDEEGDARQDFARKPLSSILTIEQTVTRFKIGFHAGLGLQFPLSSRTGFVEMYYSDARSLNTFDNKPINTFNTIGLQCGIFF